MNDYLKILSANILSLRKERGLTQENIAERLNISFQAVSKWENGQCAPDIMLLPPLADMFGVSIDSLLGRKSAAGELNVPWGDDDTIRGMVFRGRTLLGADEDLTKFTFNVEGEAVNVQSNCSVNCGPVVGNIEAGVDVNCGPVVGNINAGVDVKCGNIGGSVNAGVNVTCGDVGGDANAGVELSCKGCKKCR